MRGGPWDECGYSEGGCAVGLAETGTLVMGHHSIGCISGSGNTLHFTSFSHSSVGEEYYNCWHRCETRVLIKELTILHGEEKVRENVLEVCIVLLA